MRLPREEDDGLISARRATYLSQHALLTGLHKIEVAEAEGIRLDHFENHPIAVVARFDSVDLPIQLVTEVGNRREVVQPGLGGRCKRGERVLRTLQVRPYGFDRTVLSIGSDVPLHRRHPVAKED